ncbi:MAG TPA: lipid-A-disaccharide synthase [Gammaproteobacteria bacterium]|nr:lipid-A-disaccharide synthase [Gammaproteobacteria bacterium]
MRIGIVAGESSGDILGAGLMRSLRARVPGVRFEGVAGPEMLAAGCEPLYPAETLAVMGLAEVLQHLPRLLRVRRHLRRHFLADPPDLFVGIDSPDFNLGLETSLRRAGIPTVHYVSPSVWAWRPKRVFTVGRAADLLLTLLPFEPAYYRKHGFHAEFVGHPLADAIPADIDRVALRRSLPLPANGPLVALLPGSRVTEVERLLGLFLETARCLAASRPELCFAVPAATPKLGALIKERLQGFGGLPLTVVPGHSREILGAADAALLASGTATLEAMLLQCPMVVAYKLAPVSHALIRTFGLLRIPHVALPNLLAGRAVVPEFLQQRAEPKAMAQALLELLATGPVRAAQLQEFRSLAGILRQGADERAADAVLTLLPAVGGGKR